MAIYNSEFMISVTRKFADPARGSKTFSDKSQKNGYEAENEEQAFEMVFADAIEELTKISGIYPEIDKENRRFNIVYPNGSSVSYYDFVITKADDQ